MDMQVFCDVMHRHQLDRPPAHSTAQQTLPQDAAQRSELLETMFNQVTNSAGRVDLPGFISALKKARAPLSHAISVIFQWVTLDRRF